MFKVLYNIKNTKKYYAPPDQILGQKVWFTGKVWKRTLINFSLIYPESPFNFWKNDTRMKFLGGVVFELWSFLQYGSTRRPENLSGHNFWPVGRIFVKIKNLGFLPQNYYKYQFSLKSETWGCSKFFFLDELTWNDSNLT